MIHHNAHIGEVKIGRRDDTMSALLGSCVGVAILWPERKKYGLAHCLLPEAPTKSFSICGRYVDQAILSIIAMMSIKDSNKNEVVAVIAGGANMTKSALTDEASLVGAQNVKKAIEGLKKQNIRIIHQDTGGVEGRTINIDCASGEYKIKKIPRS